jgi:methionine aminopeptidase
LDLSEVVPSQGSLGVVEAYIMGQDYLQVWLEFNQVLQSNIVPDTTDFVFSNGISVNEVLIGTAPGNSVGGNYVVLVVSTPFTYGEAVSLTYTAGSTLLTSISGDTAASFVVAQPLYANNG